MSDMIDLHRDLRSHRRAVRAAYSVDCPKCREIRPRANPTRLLPQQRCKVDGYRDPRPELTAEQLASA